MEKYIIVVVGEKNMLELESLEFMDDVKVVYASSVSLGAVLVLEKGANAMLVSGDTIDECSADHRIPMVRVFCNSGLELADNDSCLPGGEAVAEALRNSKFTGYVYINPKQQTGNTAERNIQNAGDKIHYTEELELLKLENESLKLELAKRQLLDEALRESGNRFRDIVTSFAGWIWEIDNSLHVTYSSDYIEKLLGYQSSEIVGKRIGSIMNEKSGEKFFVCTNKQNVMEDLECWCSHKNGSSVCVSIAGLPVISRDGVFAGYRGVMKDITLRKRAEEKLSEVNSELQRSNKDLEQFAYFASHDLREPLRMISNFMSLIHARYSSVLDDKGKQFVGFALEGADRMNRMIQGLLTIARVNTHGTKFSLCDTGILLESVISDLQFQIMDTHTKIKYKSLPVVHGESSQIRSLFMNILSNSMKYRRGNSCVIHIGAVPSSNFWQFEFCDNGIGFDMKYADMVFDLFSMLESDEKHNSNGIGLALCRRIVERHGGIIKAESIQNRYTKISFTLPGQNSETGITKAEFKGEMQEYYG